MNIFKALTPITYWILIALWAFILNFYFRRLRKKNLKGSLLFTLLLILSIDAFRTLFESLYFGAWYTSLAGFLPIEVHAFLIRPEMVFVPKILNVISAVAVIFILLLKWLPQETKEKDKLEQLVESRTIELKEEIDIRENVENQLTTNNENLRKIFNSTPNILILVNGEGRVENINQKGVEFAGKAKEELLGLLGGEVLDCLNSFDGEGCGRNHTCSECPIRTRVVDTFDTGRPHVEEEGQMTFLLNSIETTVDLLISTNRLELNDTKNVLLSLTDITDLKKDETALKNSEAKHRSILQTAMDGFWLTDNSGNILETNQTYCLMSGYSQDELLTMKISDLEVKETAVDISKRIKKITTIGEDRFESSHRRKEGSVFDVEVSVQYRDDDGGRYICFLRDITGQKQLETQIQQTQKMESIGSLAGGITHDFNNILYPIIGFAEMLIDDLPLNSPERDNASEIITAGKRGSELVKQILAFSRQDEHKLVPVRVQQVLKEVIKLSRSSIPMNIEINHHLQQDCGLVLADSTQLHQIGMNLITNGYHAVEENSGKIEIQVKEIFLEKDELSGTPLHTGKYVQLSVSDNGCGISPAVMDKIFEPYFTTKEKGKGTGLGLSVVYGIVKEHKGDIKVFSEVGKGTTIKVYLPVIAASGATESGSEQMPLGRGTERILLVDDEVPIASLMKQMLERLGYSVSIRTSSVDALEAFKAKSNAFDLVITDMSMPHMTGDQLAREMLGIRPDILIIICTGFSERVNEDMVKSMGIKGFLMKPVIKSIMAKEVRKVLDDAGKI